MQKKRIIGSIFLLFFVSAVQATKKPHWIENIPKKAGYELYVGYAFDHDRERAKYRATQDAYNQAIRESFGIETKIEVHSKETMTNTSYEKKFEEISKKIKFVGFKRRKIYTEKKEKIFHVWILFQYSLKELVKEKGRIKKLMQSEKTSQQKKVLGEIEYEKGNRNKAKRLWKSVCDSGDLDGCHKVLSLEREIKKDKESARNGCEQEGNIGECFNLGLLEKESGNISRARWFYQKACDGGEMGGCNNLGVLEEESGNTSKAMALYKQACDGGLQLGCDNFKSLDSGNHHENPQDKCDSGDSSECYNLGVFEQESGNVSRAKWFYEKACDGGVIGGCFDLGILKEKSGNISKAKKLYQKACDGGLQLGCDNFRKLHSGNHHENPQDKCDSGDSSECFNLGNLEYKNGNISKAKRLWAKGCGSNLWRRGRCYNRKACDGGDMSGCSRLGYLEKKSGNISKAKKLYQEACDGGDMSGCSRLGYLEKKSGNISKAKKLYQKACDAGEIKGCRSLGNLEYKSGNISKAKRPYQKACDGGDMNGCLWLGYLEEESGNISKAKRPYQKACDGGEIVGCNNLGFLEWEGGNISKARKLLQKACDDGSVTGCSSLGDLEKKSGNISKAKILYQKACDGGGMGGCASLGALLLHKLTCWGSLGSCVWGL